METLDDVIPVTISFDPNKYVPSGAPGLTNKNTLLSEAYPKGRSISVLFPFSPRTGVTPGTCVKIHSKNVYQLPQKNLIAGHKVKIIDIFKAKRLKQIKDFVNANGAITFALLDATSSTDFFSRIPDLCSRYKYSTFFYHCGEGLSDRRRTADDVFVSFVSFIDINYCIPIFDHRKVDGMGVYCGFMYNNKYGKGSTLIDVLCFVLSNHRENLFYTDGAKVGIESRVSMDVLKYMIQRIKLKSQCKAKKTVTDKVKKAKNNKDMYEKYSGELVEPAEGEGVIHPEQPVRYSMPTYGTSSTSYTISGTWS